MRRLAPLLLAPLLAGCFVVVPVPVTVPVPTVRTTPAATQPVGAPDASALNAYRRQAGLTPLAPNPKLARAARAHAQDMADRAYFAHRSPEGATHGTRIRAAGYAPCGAAENIAEGLKSRADAMAAWMDSPGHRRNMLHPRMREYGYAQVGRKQVLVLATPC
ncbi:hypothetical protein OCGS_1903 [Oceaniovalibus guishaninsula JLT2003]|uniref:SCP domain-containing protein n=1 Tax=Oceaniovalibus guishaninsula JLT2003 TaxID=1231392 RepID=K2HBA6_9RHOB|nr:CAP domain-containing protein [Oceaniovalibus guishaninsula]EKE43922.1 hypothetical protein OCGS_1903 [Oceaniovalibus guishaninsula JLT2003]